MTNHDIIAVGPPPTFKQQVARALGRDADQVSWVPTVTAAESSLSERAGAASVVVLSPVVKESDAFGLADFVNRTSPATAVVMVRDQALNGLLPAAMRAGVRDVVDLSVGSQELTDALRRAISWSANLRSMGIEPSADQSEDRGVVVTVFSTKGGTGKTFLTTNLAVALAERSGRDTAVVDFDLEMGDVLSYFGKDTKAAVEDVIAVGAMTDRQAIRQAAVQVADRVWAFAGRAEPGTSTPISGEAAGQLLQTLRAHFGYVVVDGAAVYTDQALAAFDVSDWICLITGLDVVGVRHLAGAVETLRALGLPRERLRVILNRADSKVGLTVEEVETVLKVKVDALIPSSKLVPTALNWGRPVVTDSPKSEVSRALGSLADSIVAAAPATHGGAEPNGSKARKKLPLFRH
jgi:pilus assembly protein CpaE